MSSEKSYADFLATMLADEFAEAGWSRYDHVQLLVIEFEDDAPNHRNIQIGGVSRSLFQLAQVADHGPYDAAALVVDDSVQLSEGVSARARYVAVLLPDGEFFCVATRADEPDNQYTFDDVDMLTDIASEGAEVALRRCVGLDSGYKPPKETPREVGEDIMRHLEGLPEDPLETKGDSLVDLLAALTAGVDVGDSWEQARTKTIEMLESIEGDYTTLTAAHLRVHDAAGYASWLQDLTTTVGLWKTADGSYDALLAYMDGSDAAVSSFLSDVSLAQALAEDVANLSELVHA